MTLRDSFYRMAEQEGISVFEIEMEGGLPNHHLIRLMGDRAVYEGHALFLEEERLFVFYVIWGLRVSEELCEKTAWELMKLNYELKMGQWFIDPDSRVLTLRATQYLPEDDGKNADRMHEIVKNCGNIAEAYYPKFSSLVG